MKRPEELECVALLRDLPKFGLRAGQAGVVVFVHKADAIEVEFMDDDGETVAIVTVLDKDVRVLTDDEARRAPNPDPLPPGADVRHGNATAPARR